MESKKGNIKLSGSFGVLRGKILRGKGESQPIHQKPHRTGKVSQPYPVTALLQTNPSLVYLLIGERPFPSPYPFNHRAV